MRRAGGSDDSESRQHDVIISEATQLLRRMSFWSNRGAYAEGRYVAITVDPRWSDDRDTMQAVLTCYAFGQQVDWRKLPIIARPANAAHPYGVAHLNARGQALLLRLQPDDYRLDVPERYGRGDASLPINAQHDRLAAASEAPDASFEPRIYEAPDGSLRATVRRTRDGVTVVAFETEEATLAGAALFFAFVLESGEVWRSASVTLAPVEEEPGLWEARWEAEIAFTERCDFEFGVITRDT